MTAEALTSAVMSCLGLADSPLRTVSLMTKKKDPLKTAARRRMAATGESYQAARQAVLDKWAARDEAELKHGTPSITSGPLFQEPAP